VVAQSPYLSHALYAGTNAGIFVSRDDGKSWKLGSALAGVYSVAFDPNRTSVVVFGANRGQIYESVDEGYSFVPFPLTLPLEDVTGLAIGADGRLYAVLASGGLYVTGNEGIDWYPVAVDSPYKILSVAIDPSDPSKVYLGTAGGGVYLLDHDSGTAVPMDNGLAGQFVFCILPRTGPGATILAGTANGVFTSADGGATWALTTDGLPSGYVLKLIEGAAQRAVYALVNGAGVYRTAGGTAWAPAGTGIDANVTALAAHPADPQRLYAGTDLQGIYRSGDASQTWQTANNGISLFVRAIVIDPRDPNIMYTGSLSARIFKTIDGEKH
jgi:photosystem II stability/assembly factor-like uncharacterized protein